LQIGKGEVETQSALGRLEVGGILLRAPLEAIVVRLGGRFLHTRLTLVICYCAIKIRSGEVFHMVIEASAVDLT
jgi:hypothetical protein